MKKFLILVLLVLFAVGCAKKYVRAPEEPVKAPVETKEEKPAEVKKEVIEEKISPKPAEIKKEDVVKEVVEEEALSKKEKQAAGRTQEESILRDISFDFDKYDIREDARPLLDSIASWLKQNKNVGILIEGHCDERGTNEYNLALGEKRADAVRDYIISGGIALNRINTTSYGEEKPLCTEQNEDCWLRNRRAHFVIAN